jgi:hypothetical protein
MTRLNRPCSGRADTSLHYQTTMEVRTYSSMPVFNLCFGLDGTNNYLKNMAESVDLLGDIQRHGDRQARHQDCSADHQDLSAHQAQ